MTDFVLSLDQIDRHDLPHVGGKGANLGEMAQAGFPIPIGFCVTTEAYKVFVEPVMATIRTRLEGLDPSDLDILRVAGQDVRAILKQSPFPDSVATAIRAELRQGRPDQAYAVRSSATAEDLPTASFAGQQDTYLNITGENELIEKIHDCFVSLYTDRAILYRIQNDFSHDEVALSVVVQEMVYPEVSGIMFTADPVSGNRDVVSIDASFGLGEALVSGLVTADLYKLDKSSDAPVSVVIGAKAIAIMPLPDGGTETVTLSQEQQSKRALDDALVRELTQIGAKIEAHYGVPQDIEWALVGDRFYITQSRPITSLFPIPQPSIEPDAPRIYLSVSHLQVMTDPMPPMAISIWRQVPQVGQDAEGQFAYFLPAGGRIYADVSPMLRHPIMGRLFLKMMGIADTLAQSALEQAVQSSRFRAGHGRLHLVRLLWSLRNYVVKVPATFLFGPPAGIIDKANALIADFQERNIGSGPEALEHSLEALRDVVPIAGEWIPRLMPGIISQRLLRSLMPRSAAPLLDAFERGIEGNVVTEMNLMLGDLADLVANSPQIGNALERLSAGDKAATDSFPPEFVALWDRFLETYGDRANSEIDISQPRWRDEPAPIAQMILSLSKRDGIGKHRIHSAQLLTEAREAETQIVSQANWVLRPLVRRLVGNAKALMPLREHHKFLMIIGLSKARNTLLGIASQLVSKGVLTSEDDIWFLEIDELRALLKRPDASIGSLISQRRSEFAHDATRTPPRVMTDRGEIPTPQISREDVPENALVGTPVSAGVFEGRAHVIREPGKETLAPGDILVAPYTDPGWTPLFFNAGALVTEVGGLMTHGSVVAREYGIPAVVGVPDATLDIRTGDLIRVNGTDGFVEILG